jgi:hypothetical protein
VTLPEDVMTRLRAIDSDLGRAIVTMAEDRAPRRERRVRTAELATYGKQAVIVVLPVRTLKRLSGVQLVPIGNGRALISLDRLRSSADFELQLNDALERNGVQDDERESLQLLSSILRDARRSQSVSVQERTIIVLQNKKRRAR